MGTRTDYVRQVVNDNMATGSPVAKIVLSLAAEIDARDLKIDALERGMAAVVEQIEALQDQLAETAEAAGVPQDLVL